jgi:hypothetical protein
MTFKQMTDNLARNAVSFATDGEVAKAQACLELIAFVRDQGFGNIRGQIEITVDNT